MTLQRGLTLFNVFVTTSGVLLAIYQHSNVYWQCSALAGWVLLFIEEGRRR